MLLQVEGELSEMGQQRFVGGYIRVKRLETRGNAMYAMPGKQAYGREVCSVLILLCTQRQCLLKGQCWEGRSAPASPSCRH